LRLLTAPFGTFETSGTRFGALATAREGGTYRTYTAGTTHTYIEPGQNAYVLSE